MTAPSPAARQDQRLASQAWRRPARRFVFLLPAGARRRLHLLPDRPDVLDVAQRRRPVRPLHRLPRPRPLRRPLRRSAVRRRRLAHRLWTVASSAITTLISLFLAVVLQQKFRGRSLDPRAAAAPLGHRARDRQPALALDGASRFRRHRPSGQFARLSQPPRRMAGQSRARLPADDLGRHLGLDPVHDARPRRGLQAIDTDLYEAAALDGASHWRLFLDITLPQLRPVLAVSILLNVIFVFNSFPIIWVMTEGGPAGATDTLITFLYPQGFPLLRHGRRGGDLGGRLPRSSSVFAMIHTRSCGGTCSR